MDSVAAGARCTPARSRRSSGSSRGADWSRARPRHRATSSRTPSSRPADRPAGRRRDRRQRPARPHRHAASHRAGASRRDPRARDRRPLRIGQDLARAAARGTARRADRDSSQQFYPGWNGLQAGIDLLVEAVLVPLAAGDTVQVPRYDWLVGRFVEPWPLEPPELLIVEGVGAGARAAAAFASVLVWLELDAALRRERALARDGEVFRPYWSTWARAGGRAARARADSVSRRHRGAGHVTGQPSSSSAPPKRHALLSLSSCE